MEGLEAKELRVRLEAAEEMAREFERENKSGEVEPTANQTVEKCEKALEKLDGARVEAQLLAAWPQQRALVAA